MNLLCTDKTGTITENRLVYQNKYLVPDSRFHPLVLARLAAHDLKVAQSQNHLTAQLTKRFHMNSALRLNVLKFLKKKLSNQRCAATELWCVALTGSGCTCVGAVRNTS